MRVSARSGAAPPKPATLLAVSHPDLLLILF
jgi:hypothetical protein